MALSDVLPPVQSDEPAHRLLPAPIGNAVYGWLGPLAVTLFAFALRFWRLATPMKTAFDEVYYSCDAQMLLRYGYEHAHRDNNVCIVDPQTTGGSFVAHPPLGKWVIALGEKIFGYDPNGGSTAAFGWRISACVVGALSILVLCRLGRRLFRSTFLGCFAGFLLALDGLHFVQSRMAMLDIFLMFWILCAAACLVADRDATRRRLAARLGPDRSYPGPRLGVRWWRIAAGACLGAAGGTKWSAIYYIAAFALLVFLWDMGARRAAGIVHPFRAALRRDTAPLLLAFALVPLVVYLASWSGWFFTHGGWRRDCGGAWTTDCGPIAGFVKYHREMWHFHTTLTTKHNYASKPFGWLLLARPVSYFYESPLKGTSQEVLGIGTPAIWWASIVALVACGWGWLSRRDWRAAFVLVGFAAGYLPWFWPPDRTEFLFYALPSLPFMCLALAYGAGLALGPKGVRMPSRQRAAAVAIGAYAVAVAANFFYLYPVLAAQVVPYADWHARMWFSSWI